MRLIGRFASLRRAPIVVALLAPACVGTIGGDDKPTIAYQPMGLSQPFVDRAGNQTAPGGRSVQAQDGIAPVAPTISKVAGKQVALARWRTTIGGWRADQASNGYEYFRYKGSDVGPRVIRHIVSGPVWIAPASTPIRSLVKGKLVNGKWMSVVNYDELGPGYLSAYGLIAGYFVVPGQNGRNDFDNGVRAHGSSDYLSIYSANGYSHGCHRLPNHLAIRLYSFILRHRHMKVSGDQPMGFTRQFLWKNTVYEMRIPSRGYLYEMDPPVPVNVLEGNIMGDVKKPILDYVRGIRRQSPRDLVTVFIPEYVVGHWWEQLLHNQSALRLKGRLLFAPGVMVTSVPYQLRSSEGRDEINGS